MNDLIGQLVRWANDVIATGDYLGIAFLVALETIFPPIPSEIILPLSGSLAASGRFNLFLVIACTTVGSLVGACALYGAGRLGGHERIGNWLDRHGKWLLLSRSDLERSQEWFDKRGSWAVPGARLVPGARSLISIPAGVSEMAFRRFFLFTTVGSLIWNSVLIAAGFYLGQNWQQVESWIAPFSPIVYGIMALAIAVFMGRRLWSKRSRETSAKDRNEQKRERGEQKDDGSPRRTPHESPWFGE